MDDGVVKTRPLRPLEAIRAFGTMLGGSVVLAACSAGSVASVVRGLASLRRPSPLAGLEGWGTFSLLPVNPRRTRLISRGAIQPGLAAAAYGVLLEIPHFLMERRMLLGIKHRAERSHAL